MNPPTGLTKQALLEKIDQLRELNVGSIELPQVCVRLMEGSLY
jgi:hypothetical protein